MAGWCRAVGWNWTNSTSAVGTPARKAIATKPLDAAGHHHLAGLYLLAGDGTAAEVAARRAHELAPTDAAIKQRLDYVVLSRTI